MLEQQWSGLSMFPFDTAPIFPRVVPASQAITRKRAVPDGKDYTHDRASKPGKKHMQSSVDSVLKERI